MANISNYGYEKIRSFIQNEWKYIELQEENGTTLKRFGISDGLEVDLDGDTVKYTIVVGGSDSNFANKTVAKSVVYDKATGGSPIATESFTAFTFESEDDELTIIHTIKAPQVN